MSPSSKTLNYTALGPSHLVTEAFNCFGEEMCRLRRELLVTLQSQLLTAYGSASVPGLGLERLPQTTCVIAVIRPNAFELQSILSIIGPYYGWTWDAISGLCYGPCYSP